MKTSKFFTLVIKGFLPDTLSTLEFEGFQTTFYKKGEETDFYGIHKIIQKSTRIVLRSVDQSDVSVSMFLSNSLRKIIKIKPLLAPLLNGNRAKMELVVYEKGYANHIQFSKNQIKLLNSIQIPISIVLWED
jgi:hypothetical protein